MDCNICGSKKNKVLFDLCSDMRLLGNSFQKGKSYIKVCENCGFVYCDFDNASQKEFSDFYNSSSYHAVRYEEVQGKKTESYLKHSLSCVEKYIDKSSAVLDVSGGYGELSEYFVQKGYQNVTLLEINEPCLKEVQEKGIKTKKIDIAKACSEKGECYDVALVTHDLEHYVDVTQAMETIRNLLKPEGIALFDVPDLSSYTKQKKPPYYFLTYQHVLHFTEITLRNLVKKAGFEILSVEYYTKCDDYPSIAMVCRKTELSACSMEKDIQGEKFIQEYEEDSLRSLGSVAEKVASIRKPLILWGVGASTAQLLTGTFDKSNVIQIVDSNPAKSGLEFQIGEKKMVCQTPDQIIDSEAGILILSTAWGKEIEKTIRSLGLKNVIYFMEDYL